MLSLYNNRTGIAPLVKSSITELSPPHEQVQSEAKRRILRAFVQRRLIASDDAKEMVAHQHSGGFPVNAGVCIASDDRTALERFLRYCARPPFAMERLHQCSPAQLIYHSPKPQSGRAAIRGKRGDLVRPPFGQTSRQLRSKLPRNWQTQLWSLSRQFIR